MIFKRFLIAGAFVVGTAAAANAADLPMTPMAPPPPPPMAAPAFDWSGLYFGFNGGVFYTGTIYPSLGAQVGFNMVRGRFLAGIEAEAGVIYTGAIIPEAYLNGRLGFVLGERVLLYGEAGVGFIFGPGPVWDAGAGLEIGIRDTLSIFTEAALIGAFGGGTVAYSITAGVNFHR